MSGLVRATADIEHLPENIQPSRPVWSGAARSAAEATTSNSPLDAKRAAGGKAERLCLEQDLQEVGGRWRNSNSEGTSIAPTSRYSKMHGICFKEFRKRERGDGKGT